MTEKVDVVVIGAGIVGLFSALELAEKGYNVLVVEKNEGPGLESTSKNAGVIHVIQLPFDSLKSRLCIEGNLLYHELDETHNFRVRWVTAYLASTSRLQRPLSAAIAWYLRRRLPHDFKVSLIGSRELRRVEPVVSKKVDHAVSVEGYGVVDPAMLASRVAEIVKESASISLRDPVTGIRVDGERVLVDSARGGYEARLVVNAAGLYADDLAAMVGDSYRVIPVKGVMAVYDSVKVDSILTWLRAERRLETKGGGVIPHARGALLGPTYSGVADKSDYTYTEAEVEALTDRFQPLLNRGLEGPPQAIVGLRATSEKRDFFIEYSGRTSRVIHLVGIESPGLTAAPAIAKRVAEMTARVLP